MTEGPGIVDAHIHLWDPHRFELGWIAGSALDRPHLARDYAEAVRSAHVEAYVAVEANAGLAHAVAEAAWLRGQAALDSRLRGLIAGAPVEVGARALGKHLQQLTDAAGDLLRGVRRDLQGEADPAFCLRPGFLSGLRLLPEYRLTFDICVSPHQLRVVEEMVRRCPETTFVLDHLGKPAVGSRVLDPWRADIEALAKLPNLFCKISGLLTEAPFGPHEPDLFGPYVEHVLDVFDENRVLFGSDWPVITQAGALPRWLQIVRVLTRGLGPEAHDKLFRRNAAAVYRLDLSSSALGGTS